MADMAGHDIDYIAVSGALHGIGPRTIRPLHSIWSVTSAEGGCSWWSASSPPSSHAGHRCRPGGRRRHDRWIGAAHRIPPRVHGRRMVGAGAGDEPPRRSPPPSTRPIGPPTAAMSPSERWSRSSSLRFSRARPGPARRSEHRTTAKLAGPTCDRRARQSVFRTRTRDDWELSHFQATDACVAPVLSLAEAPEPPP